MVEANTDQTIGEYYKLQVNRTGSNWVTFETGTLEKVKFEQMRYPNWVSRIVKIVATVYIQD